jgi:hypothetical protein
MTSEAGMGIDAIGHLQPRPNLQRDPAVFTLTYPLSESNAGFSGNLIEHSG